MNARILLILFPLLILLSGCSKVVLKSDVDPNVELAELKTFYVRKFAPDNRGLEKIISSQLVKLGYQASSGVGMQSPTPVDAIVTYNDRWMWDITMYMLEINLQFRDPETDFIFASGNSYRTSLVRKSPEYMIEEVLRDMLGRPPMPKSE